jgi:hypothetical protein
VPGGVRADAWRVTPAAVPAAREMQGCRIGAALVMVVVPALWPGLVGLRPSAASTATDCLRTFKVAFMAGAVERIEDRLRMQRFAEIVQVVASRSLMLATDVENDNYIARRFSFVQSGPEREHSVDRAAFQAGWRRAEDILLSNRPALPAARHRRSGRR